ncbi:MAG: ATP-grasp domain-containing protein, partial [Synergistetes bacterium]|nr:ATP-grasp domain-containing protein [Synergistota bacterium]
MGKKTLLVFGTGADQIPGIRRAKEMDIYLVGLDADPYSRGASLVDEFYPVSIKHVKEVETFLQSYKSRSIDGVIAFGVDIPDILARASEILGVHYYTTYKLASVSKDKYFAKELMKDYNVNLPEYESIAHFSDLKKAVNKFGYPCVLKPVDNSGARGVLRLTKGVDLKWAYEFSRSYSGSRRLIVEKFLQGVQ